MTTEASNAAPDISWRVKYRSSFSGQVVQWGATPFDNEARRWLERVRDLYPGQESWAEEVSVTEAVKRLDW